MNNLGETAKIFRGWGNGVEKIGPAFARSGIDLLPVSGTAC